MERRISVEPDLINASGAHLLAHFGSHEDAKQGNKLDNILVIEADEATRAYDHPHGIGYRIPPTALVRLAHQILREFESQVFHDEVLERLERIEQLLKNTE